MRKYLYTALCSVLVVTLFSACGGGSSAGSSTDASASSSDGLFGSVSGVIAECVQKKTDFQKKMETIKDMEEAAKLAKQSNELDETLEAMIEAAAQKLVGKKIPYEMTDSLFYTITSEPVVTKAFANGTDAVSMNITFRAAQKEAMEISKMAYLDYPICYKLVDANGSPLWASITYIVSDNTKPVKFDAGQDYGQDFVIDLSINKKNLDKLKNATKIVFISKVGYDEVKK